MSYSFLLHCFVINPSTKWILKQEKWTKSQRWCLAILFLGLVAVVPVYIENMDKQPNYYHLLGVTTDATATQIKQGYKRASLMYHPDKNKSPDAEEIFNRVREGYELLQDPTAKSVYDKFGPESLSSVNDGYTFMIQIGSFYVLFAIVIYLLNIGKASARGRTWTYTGLLVLLILEIYMKFDNFDFLTSTFPYTTVYEKVEFLQKVFPSFMTGCHVLSIATYVDMEAQLHQRLATIEKNQAKLLNEIRMCAWLIQTKGGKKTGATDGKIPEPVTEEVRQRAKKAEKLLGKIDAERPRQAPIRKPDPPQQSGGISSTTIITILIFVFFNWLN